MVIQREEQCLVKKRCLYIGTSVPIETTEGLGAIQQPLRDRYPVDDDAKVEGLDAWVSILLSGLRLEYVEDTSTVTRFPISSLSICAAVRKVRSVNASTGEVTSNFVSLTSQQAGGMNAKNPAIFTAITRRTSGRRVLECHGFVCLNDRDALDLVRATKHVDGVYKRNGTIPTPRSSQIYHVDSKPNGGIPNGAVNGVSNLNGSLKKETTVQNGSYNVRLVPGDAVESVQNVAPEFYDTVPTQGYFYKTAKAEVKKFNVEKLTDRAQSDIGPYPSRVPLARPPPPMSARGFPVRAPTLIRPVPRPVGPGMPMTLQRRPMYVGPPPPPRPRFFSPPPMMRGSMYGPPPPPPPGPMMMPYPPQPIFVRRPRPRSHSDDSKESSRDSSPKYDNTSPKRANGDFDTESDISAARPKTPPRDYDAEFDGPVQQRMSRRDAYEKRNRKSESPQRRSPPRQFIPPGYPPYMQPYYGVPMHPAFMYHGRSRSVPPPMRYPTEDRKSKKSKRNKKKNKKKNRGIPSDVSTDSIAGYKSEIPYGLYPPPGPFDMPPRRPRDFRREENQFMNERLFSRHIQEETRKSRGLPTDDHVPTAYELNDVQAEEKIKDSEFSMY